MSRLRDEVNRLNLLWWLKYGDQKLMETRYCPVDGHKCLLQEAFTCQCCKERRD